MAQPSSNPESSLELVGSYASDCDYIPRGGPLTGDGKQFCEGLHGKPLLVVQLDEKGRWLVSDLAAHDKSPKVWKRASLRNYECLSGPMSALCKVPPNQPVFEQILPASVVSRSGYLLLSDGLVLDMTKVEKK